MSKTLFVALSLLLATPAFSETNPEFSSTKKIDGSELVLNGTGMRKATFLGIKVYKAGLYLKNKTTNAQEVVSAELPKYLELKFVRNVEAEKIREAWSDSIKNNNENAAQLSGKIEALNKAMKDIKEGDALTFSFLKNNTTKVSLAGTDVVTIEGADFQTALLKVWMGPKPPNEELKQGLLSALK